MSRARTSVVLFVVVALVAAVVVERDPAPDETSTLAVDSAAAGPLIGPLDALGSTWYCPAGSVGEPDADVDHTVVIVNVADADRHAVVTLHPGTEDPVVVELDVAPESATRLDLAEHVETAAAALVEVDGGGVAVSHHLATGNGADSGACASASSDVWHFAWGDTSRDARSVVALFNPFPGDAVVDLRFVTSDGVREPQALTGVVVPGGSVVVADVGAEVARREQVSATVTARSGRVVAERVQTFDGTAGREGLAVDMGVAEPRTTWVHPYGRVAESTDQRVVVFNPGEAPAQVDVEVSLPEGTLGGVEPFELTIQPFDYATIDLGAEDRLLDVLGEAGGEFTLTVRSLNDVAVVSEVVTTGGGVAASSGAATLATEHVLAAPAIGEPARLGLRIVNLDADGAATGTVGWLDDGDLVVPTDGQVEVPSGGRLVVELHDLDPAADALVLTTDVPVVAELVALWTEPAARSIRPAVPTSARLEPPPSIDAGG